MGSKDGDPSSCILVFRLCVLSLLLIPILQSSKSSKTEVKTSAAACRFLDGDSDRVQFLGAVGISLSACVDLFCLTAYLRKFWWIELWKGCMQRP